MSTDRWLLAGGLAILVAALIAGDLFLFNATTTAPQTDPMSTPDTAPAKAPANLRTCYSGATLTEDGTETRPIIGVPLDGSAGNRLIPDTDHSALDGDPVHDRAVGPFQFLPQTWHAYTPPGANPQNIDAAALAADRYLCTGNRDLSTGRDWWAEVLSYNNSMSYAREVFADTNSYAAASVSR